MDILTQDGTTQITTQQFLALHPDKSFPVPIPYADFGWFVVAPQGQPTYDPITQIVQEGAPMNSGGHWLQTWAVVQLDAPTVAVNLAAAQAARIAALANSYATAIAAPVSFTTAAGVTKTFQADPASIANLANSLLGLSAAQATPTGFYWVSADNTQVAMIYADLQHFAAAMYTQGFTAFAKLQTLKAQVLAATTTAAINAVVW